MGPLITALCLGLMLMPAVQGRAAAKPSLRVAPDGFPAGRSTPEGAASDLARAFIAHDSALFRRTCIRSYGPPDYSRFLDAVVEGMREEAGRPTPSAEGPKSLQKVFAARHLTRNGPASYGYAAFGFQDVMFVDVGLLLHDGERTLTRTMVIKDKDGQWYAHPDPAVSPLLSMGLNEESPSKRDFSEAYSLLK